MLAEGFYKNQPLENHKRTLVEHSVCAGFGLWLNVPLTNYQLLIYSEKMQ